MHIPGKLMKAADQLFYCERVITVSGKDIGMILRRGIILFLPVITDIIEMDRVDKKVENVVQINGIFSQL